MKSKTKWLIQGERNTAYFHLSTLARRSKNRNVSVKNSMGDWITEIKEVKDVFQKGFVNLYQTEQCCCKWECPTLDILGSRLSEKDAMRIASPPSNMEILKALNTMKPFKAPRIDRLHAGFFQRF